MQMMNHTNWDFPEIKMLFLMKRFKNKFYFILKRIFITPEQQNM